jgi:hypothetical protein
MAVIFAVCLGAALLSTAAAPAALRAAPASPAVDAAPVLVSRTQVWMGHGFDTCEIPSFDALQEWIRHSPYGAVNLYIGGAGRFCSNQALNAAFLARLSEIGWKFIPTWVGPQAPCYINSGGRPKPLMDADPLLSYDQGVAEANAAIAVATELGLAETDGTGTIVYYDMEYYDAGNVTCNEAVRAFISGWTGELRHRGNLVGVYSTGAVLSGLATIDNVPDAVWPARWIYTVYTPAATVWDVPNLSNTLWVNHQRIRQYAGGHNETWGGVTLQIDCDVVDGIVASIPTPRPFRAYLPALIGAAASSNAAGHAP